MASRITLLLALLSACAPTPGGTDSDSNASTGSASTSGATGTTGASTTDATTTDTSSPTTGVTSGATSTSSTTDPTSTTTPTSTTDPTSSTTDTTTGNDPLCEGTGETTLPGVTIVFPPQPCVFTLAEAAAGITFSFTVEVADAVDEVTPLPMDAGGCGSPGPSGLIVEPEVDGEADHYCLCDQGLCPPPDEPPVSLAPGSYAGEFTWNGVNWSGPSDTNNPFGPPFPPGEYFVRARAGGTFGAQAQEFQVRGELPITLVP